MSTIVAAFFSSVDVPLVAPGNVPTIRIRRTDTQALVVTDLAMTEQGDGLYSYDFSPVVGLDYSVRADGDPTASGQTVAGGRYAVGSLSGDTADAEGLVQTNLDATVSSRATQAQILSDATPFAGANVDVAISTRSDFDELTDPVELLDAGGAAGTSAAELVVDIGTDLSATHGAGSWLGSTLSAAAIATAVWSEVLPGAFGPGTAGLILGTNLDVVLSTRAAPGDAMTLTVGERTAVATEVDSVLGAAHGVGSWATATGFAVPGDAMALTVAERTATATEVDSVLSAAHGAGSWVGAGLTVTQDDRLRTVWKILGLDPLQPTTHTTATIAADGSISTPDTEIDVTVDQVDANTATFTQA